MNDEKDTIKVIDAETGEIDTEFENVDRNYDYPEQYEEEFFIEGEDDVEEKDD